MTPTVPHYFRIFPGESLPDLTKMAPFKAVVVVDPACSSDWQNEVSDWLVASGCRYMMAWGRDCENWHDAVDHADIARNPDLKPASFVMTTWHENEPLEEVFWFSQFCAEFSYDDVELTTAVILHISNTDQRAAMLSLFEKSFDLAEREEDLPPS